MKKRVALVGYTSDNFLPFARALEKDGFSVFWITGLTSHVFRLRKIGVPAARILEISDSDPRMSGEEATEHLKMIEDLTGDAPLINDIIGMDRILRRRPESEARRYLATAAQAISRFVLENDIQLVSSGRDTALQMISMLVCRKAGRLWVVPTRTRLPWERYGFQTTHHLERYLKLREVSPADRTAAEAYLREFRERQLVAAARPSAGSFKDVAARLPVHVRLLVQALKEALYDRGNRKSRYTLGDLGRMYGRRRMNLVDFKLRGSFEKETERPYVLYALHTQPESSIDVSGSLYSDQAALVGQIARSVPCTHRLYVKIHPSDIDGRPWNYYQRLLAIPGVSLVGPHTPSRALLLGCAAVFSITGTIAYEAGLLGIPAITFTKLYFNRLPSVHYCTGVTELAPLVARVLQARPSETPGDREAIVEFLAELFSNSVPGDVNRIHLPLTDADLDSLTSVYNRLFEIGEEMRDRASRRDRPASLSFSA